jgi:hypothetical protein
MEQVKFELNALYAVFMGSTCKVLEMAIFYTLRQADNPESIKSQI